MSEGVIKITGDEITFGPAPVPVVSKPSPRGASPRKKKRKSNRGSKPGVKRGSYKKVAKDPGPEIKIGPSANEDDEIDQVKVGDSFDFGAYKKKYEQARDPDENENSNSTDPFTVINEPAEPPHADPIVTGATLLLLINTIFPMLAVIAVRVISKGKKKATLKYMRLDEEERETLEPLCDAAADQLLGRMSPVALLAVTLASIYAGKIMTASAFLEVQVEKAETL